MSDDEIYVKLREMVGHSWEDGKPQAYTKLRDHLWTILAEYEYVRLCEIQGTTEPFGTLDKWLEENKNASV